MNRLPKSVFALCLLLMMASSSVFGQAYSNRKSLFKQLHDFEQGKISLSLVEQINLYNQVANKYKFRYPDSLRYYAQKALDLNSPIISEKAFVLSTMRIGDYHNDKGEKELATAFYDQSQELIDSVDEPMLQIMLLQGRALNYFFNYRSEKWYSSLAEAIKISMDNDLEVQHAILHHIKGYLFYTYKMYEEAEIEQLKAGKIFEEIGKPAYLVHVKSNLALNSLDWGKKEDFLQYSADAMDLLLRYPDKLWERRVYHAIGKYHFIEGNYQKALQWNESAEELLTSITLERETMENYGLKSRIFLGLKELDSAHVYAIQTREMASHLKDTVALIQSYEDLHQIAEARGAESEKKDYLLLAHQAMADFNERSKNYSMLFLKERNELENEKKAIRRINAQKARNRDLFIRITIIILIGLALVGLQLFLNRRNQVRIRKELEAINSSKNKLFSVVSHDLIHPIDKLKESLALFRDGHISEDEVLSRIPLLQSKVEHSSFTLNNLLYWAQSQMSGIKANPKEIDLKDRIALSCDRFMEEMKEKELDVACEIPKKLKVWFDVNHLDVVVQNMVSNAVKYTPVGGKIRFRAFEEENHISFELNNEGESIPGEILEYLNKNGQGNFKSTSLQDTTTGVGLKVVKELVDLNYGRFHYGYTPNKGNLIVVKMPKSMSLKAVV